jgi:hypothetical protein
MMWILRIIGRFGHPPVSSPHCGPVNGKVFGSSFFSVEAFIKPTFYLFRLCSPSLLSLIFFSLSAHHLGGKHLYGVFIIALSQACIGLGHGTLGTGYASASHHWEGSWHRHLGMGIMALDVPTAWFTQRHGLFRYLRIVRRPCASLDF